MESTEERARLIYSVSWRLLKRVTLLVASVYLAVRYGPYVLVRLTSIFVSVVAAIVLMYALMPTVDWLATRRLRFVKMRARTQRLIATIVVFVAFLGLAALCVSLFVTPIQQELEQFSRRIGDYTDQLGEVFKSVSHWYRTRVPESVKGLIGKLDYSRLTSGITDWAQRVLKVLTSSVEYALELVLIPVLAFYFLLDYKSLTHELYALAPGAKRKTALKIGRGVGEILQSYVFGQLILCAIAGLATGLFLTIMKMPYVVVLALFAAITRAIPIIGPVISGVPIVLVGLIYSGGHIALPLYLLVFVVVMHFAESKFVMPKLIGRRLHLHPATVIIVLLLGAEFLGIIGMFLAAPVAAIVREIVRLYYIRPRETRDMGGV
ncbi:MAG: AI-2E family transporter [Armatimonadetes bacterium]|nr:AI-2E family transporter [Armatimonadota bacterium]